MKSLMKSQKLEHLSGVMNFAYHVLLNDNWRKYCSFTSFTLSSAVNDLNAYFNDKQYTLSSLALDLVLYAMSTVTVCTVNVN